MGRKICYIVTMPMTINAFFIPQLNYLAEKGFDVSLVCSQDEKDPLRDTLSDKIHKKTIQIPRGVSVAGTVSAIKRLTDYFKKESFDMIQYSTPNAAFCASIGGVLAKVPVRNYHLMGLRYLGNKGISRMILKQLEIVSCSLSTSIECVSQSNLELCIKEKLFKKGKGTVVLHGSSGGIDLSRFNVNLRAQYRSEIRKKYAINESTFVFGFVGRITKDKGINEILSAFEKLGLDNVKLLMVGSTEGADTLDQDLYKRSQSNPNVIYTGPVKDVERYYSAIDVLLLPSYREGFGNVIIEAAAMGTPAIVSEIPGPIDTSLKDETALWITPGNSDELRKAMIQIENDRSKHKAMTERSVNFVKESFDDKKLNEAIYLRKLKLLKESN